MYTPFQTCLKDLTNIKTPFTSLFIKLLRKKKSIKTIHSSHRWCDFSYLLKQHSLILVTQPIKFQDKSIWPTVRVFPWQQRPPGIHVTHLNRLPKTPALRRGHTTTERWSHASLILIWLSGASFIPINICFKKVSFWNKASENMNW